MAHEQVVAILNEMSPDDRTALLEELPSAAARQLIRSAHARRTPHAPRRCSVIPKTALAV